MTAAAPWTGVRGKRWDARGRCDGGAICTPRRYFVGALPPSRSRDAFSASGTQLRCLRFALPGNYRPAVRVPCLAARKGEKRCKVSNSRSLNHLFGTRGCLRASVRRFGRGSSSGGYPCSQSNHCGRAVGLGAIAPCAWAPMRRSRRRLPVANLGAFMRMISNCAKSHVRWLARGSKACPGGR
jgi:hypothetical protein